MSSPPRSPAAGGALIALSLAVGTVAGFVAGQATAGFLIGGAAGIALAIAVWLRGR